MPTCELLWSAVTLLVHDERVGLLQEEESADGGERGNGRSRVEGEVKTDLTQEGSDDRSNNIGDRKTSFQSRQVHVSMIGSNQISNNTRIKGEEKANPWTRIKDPENKPVKERQMMRVSIDLERPWNKQPSIEPRKESNRNGFLP